MNGNFYFFENILFSNIVKKPPLEEIFELRKKFSKTQIERFYNHFHINAICENPKLQREIAGRIWESWRIKFLNNFPEKTIAIEINDLGEEVILYVYEKN
jgi:hypothetical protein